VSGEKTGANSRLNFEMGKAGNRRPAVDDLSIFLPSIAFPHAVLFGMA